MNRKPLTLEGKPGDTQWEVFKDGQSTGIIETNLAHALKHWQERADTYDTQRETFHTYKLVGK